MKLTLDQVHSSLTENPRTWLVTGAAGFIGSNLVEELLRLGQRVVGLDNFATGKRENIAQLETRQAAGSFKFIEGDILSSADCRNACSGVDVVLHQAALGSVSRSIKDPQLSNRVNVEGFLNMLCAARECGVKRFVYASSSSVYGDITDSPKCEARIGRPLSPYAVTKQVDELYAGVFGHIHGMATVGLRYFNVFGPRQDPEGEYAAVIPRWINKLKRGERCTIFGDGETTRDFCFVKNVVAANLLSAINADDGVRGLVLNIACGEQTSLNKLYQIICEELKILGPDWASREPSYESFRPGDVRHSLADISSAREEINYKILVPIREGLRETVRWFSGCSG